MKIDKGSGFYKATELCATMWDTFRDRKPWSDQCVTRRLPMGMMDICTVGRVFLFAFLYFAAWLALFWFGIQWAFVYPLVDIANLSAGATQLVNMLTGTFTVAALITGFIFLVKYIRKTKMKSWFVEVDERERLMREKPKKVKKPNLFWQAIVLRYKAFKEKTCFLLEVEDKSENV